MCGNDRQGPPWHRIEKLSISLIAKRLNASLHAYAERIDMMTDGLVVGEHTCSFERNRLSSINSTSCRRWTRSRAFCVVARLFNQRAKAQCPRRSTKALGLLLRSALVSGHRFSGM